MSDAPKPRSERFDAWATRYVVPWTRPLFAFAKATWPDLSITVTTVETSSADDPRFRVRVRVGGAMVWTSVKIDGVAVPGGYVVTEWV